MSTRSNIAIKHKDNTYDMIYCHSDGYLEYNGVVLYKYYQDENKIKNLIDLGDISLLGLVINPDPTIVHSFDYDKRQKDVTVAYGRDRNENDTSKHIYNDEKSFLDSFKDTWCEYLYLYDENSQKWLWAEIPYGKDKNINLKLLEETLKEKGLITEKDEKLDNLIKETVDFLYDFDPYEFKDTYESYEDAYYETERLFSSDLGLTKYIEMNKTFLDGLEDDLDFSVEAQKIYKRGIDLNQHIREYRKEMFRDKADELEII